MLDKVVRDREAVIWQLFITLVTRKGYLVAKPSRVSMKCSLFQAGPPRLLWNISGQRIRAAPNDDVDSRRHELLKDLKLRLLRLVVNHSDHGSRKPRPLLSGSQHRLEFEYSHFYAQQGPGEAYLPALPV